MLENHLGEGVAEVDLIDAQVLWVDTFGDLTSYQLLGGFT